MAEEAFLKGVRERLSKRVGEIWEMPEAQAIAEQLEKAAVEAGIAGKEGTGAYSRAFSEPRPLEESYAEAARAGRLGELYESAWRVELPPESEVGARPGLRVKGALSGAARESWTWSERERLEEFIRGLDIDDLYDLCAAGKFEEVRTKLGLETTPANPKECYKAVAAAKKLGERLKAAWGVKKKKK
ncbi:MAG: hypothetical protein J7J05_00410 [Thermococcus sp.]|uniref:hypothetical protein n=1 Tax=Thermococcus sp. TaxID=35749 RepID=UPI002619CBF4|nr:hypothetical protein [Thermococcus sp.]MCD6139413.1 hypothetical protein [Thermococcus sp.]